MIAYHSLCKCSNRKEDSFYCRLDVSNRLRTSPRPGTLWLRVTMMVEVQHQKSNEEERGKVVVVVVVEIIEENVGVVRYQRDQLLATDCDCSPLSHNYCRHHVVSVAISTTAAAIIITIINIINIITILAYLH